LSTRREDAFVSATDKNIGSACTPNHHPSGVRATCPSHKKGCRVHNEGK
jgi:hypothetical protein